MRALLNRELWFVSIPKDTVFSKGKADCQLRISSNHSMVDFNDSI